MTYTPSVWDHGPKDSTATYRHVKLSVASRYYEERVGSIQDLLWGWRVSWTDSKGVHATRSGLALDRIGACVEAETAAQQVVRNVMVEHGVVDDAPK